MPLVKTESSSWIPTAACDAAWSDFHPASTLSATDYQVDLVHGLGCRGRPLDGRGEEPVVEGFDVAVTQASQADVAEPANDVALHVPFVAVERGGRELQLLAGEPLPDQVRAEGQRPHRVDASLFRDCEARG